MLVALLSSPQIKHRKTTTMSHQSMILALFVLCLIFIDSRRGEATEVLNLKAQPLAFTENRGQWDSQVAYRALDGGATLWFTNTGVLYQFTRAKIAQSADSSPVLEKSPGPQSEQILLEATFVGANPDPTITGSGLMEYKCNFFLGEDAAKWQTDVPNYEVITYRNLYDGIDLKFGDGQGRMVSEFVVAPGADYQQIKMHYAGARSVSISPSGELVIETAWGTLGEPPFAIYQEQNGSRRSISSRYEMIDDQTVRLQITGDFNFRSPLYLMPSLTFSSYLGGTGSDFADDLAINNLGESYVAGTTASANFPVLNPYDNSANGGYDALVTKFNANGNGLIFSTYLGGSLDDLCEGLSLTNSGNYSVFLMGTTQSSNFPTANSVDGSANGGSDVFVATLNSGGNVLSFSTYLGGSGDDYANDIATACGVFDCSIDKFTAWVVGETRSSNFPSLSAYNNSLQGTSDAFLTSYTVGATGNSMGRSTYFGGEGDEAANAVTLVGSFPVKPYITGRTTSRSSFPLVNAYDNRVAGSEEAFVTGFTFLAGSGVMSPQFSTYFGGNEGNGSEEGTAIIVRSSGNICIAGLTSTPNLPTASRAPFDSTHNGNIDCFVAEFNNTASALVSCTYIGGASYEAPTRMLEKYGNLYIAGYTGSPNFPTKDPVSGAPRPGTTNAFAAVLNPTVSSLLFSTFIGGSEVERATGLAVDNPGCIYVAGSTGSSDLLVVNPYSGSNSGGNDCFLLKVCLPPFTCGDADRNGVLSVSDVVYLVNYIFGGGPAPNPLSAADSDCSGRVDVSDVVYLINYIFSGGAIPCASCS